MDIKKYITKKNVIIGAVAGTAIIGGIVALVVRHHKKKEIEALDLDYLDEEFDYEDYEDECVAGNRCCDYAEQILRELEEGTYGK